MMTQKYANSDFKYLLNNPAPKYTEQEAVNEVTITEDYFNKVSKEQVVHLYLHANKQNTATIKVLQIFIDKLQAAIAEKDDIINNSKDVQRLIDLEKKVSALTTTLENTNKNIAALYDRTING